MISSIVTSFPGLFPCKWEENGNENPNPSPPAYKGKDLAPIKNHKASIFHFNGVICTHFVLTKFYIAWEAVKHSRILPAVNVDDIKVHFTTSFANN